MKVLITGGAGYIGSTIAACCTDNGITPVILDDYSKGLREFARPYANYEGDIADTALIRRILSEHGEFEIALQVTQQLLVRAADVLRRNPRDLGDDILDLSDIDTRHALVFRLQALIGAGLVDHVDGLVRHVPIIDVARSQLGRCTQRLVTVLDVVMLLETPLEPAQDADGVLHRRLAHVDLLEAALQGGVLLDVLAVLVQGGRADQAQLAAGEHRLDHVAGVHRGLAGRARADDRLARATGEHDDARAAGEEVVDRISLNLHPLSKQAKDMGSAAQMVALLMIALTWAIILL